MPETAVLDQNPETQEDRKVGESLAKKKGFSRRKGERGWRGGKMTEMYYINV